mgnify:FL=1|jgi:hypothetical protein
MTLREKLMHYTNDLGDVDLKQEVIATIKHIAQYMDEDELLHHSRPLAIAYLALTEDDSTPVVLCKDCASGMKSDDNKYIICCRLGIGMDFDDFCSHGERKDETNES